MQVSELARRTGCTPRMIRHYDEQGLLRGQRLANRYRDFPEEAVDDVLRIRTLIKAGLDTKTLRPLLGCFSTGNQPVLCPALTEQIRQTMAQLEEQERRLRRARKNLSGLLDTGISTSAITR